MLGIGLLTEGAGLFLKLIAYFWDHYSLTRPPYSALILERQLIILQLGMPHFKIFLGGMLFPKEKRRQSGWGRRSWEGVGEVGEGGREVCGQVVIYERINSQEKERRYPGEKLDQPGLNFRLKVEESACVKLMEENGRLHTPHPQICFSVYTLIFSSFRVIYLLLTLNNQ